MEDLKAKFIANFITDDRWKYFTNGLGTTYTVSFFAVILGVIIGGAILFPILMFIVGFIIVFALGIMLMFQNGSAAEVVTAGLVTWGLIAAIIGSVGSVLIIIIDG